MEDEILNFERPMMMATKPKEAEKCFCHLNNYKVKDADARNMLSGEVGMGSIKVSGISPINLLTFRDKETTIYGLTIRCINDEVFISGKSTSSGGIVITDLKKVLKLKTGKKYTMSYTRNGTVNDVFNIQLRENGVSKFMPYTYELPMTIDGNNSEIDAIRLYVPQGIEFTDYSFKLQIEEGEKASEYTRYFELPTKDELVRLSGYEIDMPLGYGIANTESVYATGNSLYHNDLTETCSTHFKRLIHKLNEEYSSELDDELMHFLSPIVINNTSVTATVDGHTFNYPKPRRILIEGVQIVKDFDNGKSHLTLDGKSIGFEAIVDNSYKQTEEARFDISYTKADNDITIHSVSMTLIEYNMATKYYVDNNSGGQSVPIYFLELNDGSSTSTNFKISKTTTFGSKVNEIMLDCFNKGIKQFMLKIYFNSSSVSNFYGRYIDVCFKIDGNNFRILNNYFICPYDTYYSRYVITTNVYHSGGSLIESTDKGLFLIQYKENTQIVTS